MRRLWPDRAHRTGSGGSPLAQLHVPHKGGGQGPSSPRRFPNGPSGAGARGRRDASPSPGPERDRESALATAESAVGVAGRAVWRARPADEPAGTRSACSSAYTSTPWTSRVRAVRGLADREHDVARTVAAKAKRRQEGRGSDHRVRERRGGAPMTRLYFVTGTDTGVGKSVVTAGLLAAARAAGVRALGLKPVAAGGFERDGEWVNEDALLLQASAGIALPYDAVNPVMLREAIAPHIAAARAGASLAVAPLAAAVRRVIDRHHPEVAFVEGAGGWLVPLNDRETLADLAKVLRAEALLVVGLRLGCLNHSLLTEAAIGAAGLRLAGWVANTIDPDMPVLAENVATLEARLPAPRLGTVPWLDEPSPGTVAATLDTRSLWGAP
jgi:dethiobiotin synthetase